MSTVEFHAIESRTRGEEVEISVLLPDGYDPSGERYPVILQLHGGGGTRHHLAMMAPLYDVMFKEGVVRPCVVACLSAGASMYIGFEDFVSKELPEWLASQYNASSAPDKLCLTGTSMGGYGTLHVGFRHPDRFCALAAMEPAIEPSYEPEPPDRRSTWWRNDVSLVADSNDGEGIDLEFVEQSPARTVRDDPEALRSANLEIYLEVGDQDYTNLHDGAEFLHRVLWDHDIRHEYHLVRWADHVGRSLLGRTVEAHRFLDAALGGGLSEPTDLEVPEDVMAEMIKIITDPEFVHTAPDDRTLLDIFNGPYGASAHALMYEEMRATAEQDPDLQRNYAILPPTQADS